MTGANTNRSHILPAVLLVAGFILPVALALGCERSSVKLAATSPKPAPSPTPKEPSSETAVADQAGTNGVTSWHKPRTDDRENDRNTMVATQIAARGIRDPHVLEAMRNVPRHWFVPKELERLAYIDRPLPIGEDQTISQPYIVALMTEALKLSAESKVFEVGTGSGYQAAVLSEITPHVFSVEIVKPLGERAIATFEKRGYATIKARIGDGYQGWSEHAPFDAIIVTCSPDHIPKPLIEQLAVGGRICIPVERAPGYQELQVVTKQPDGSIKQTSLIPVRFVPMTGQAEDGAPKDD